MRVMTVKCNNCKKLLKVKYNAYFTADGKIALQTSLPSDGKGSFCSNCGQGIRFEVTLQINTTGAKFIKDERL